MLCRKGSLLHTIHPRYSHALNGGAAFNRIARDLQNPPRAKGDTAALSQIKAPSHNDASLITTRA
jgi:hypothetical protein